MKIIEIKVFTFDELSDEAKERARAWYREGALSYDWWETTYEDAERVGLKLTSFSLDRNRHAKGRFIMSARDCANSIVENHGETCETHKSAQSFLNAALATPRAEFEDLENEFLKSILEDYSIILQKEYEYLLSDEQVDESIKANDYTFTESGKREG